VSLLQRIGYQHCGHSDQSNAGEGVHRAGFYIFCFCAGFGALSKSHILHSGKAGESHNPSVEQVGCEIREPVRDILRRPELVCPVFSVPTQELDRAATVTGSLVDRSNRLHLNPSRDRGLALLC
jgi:hypothetical protein